MNTSWIGHICVARTPDRQSSENLASDYWMDYFDSVSLDDELFAKLDQLAFWNVINSTLEVLIDQYEEEWIPAPKLEKLQVVINAFVDSLRDSQGNAGNLKDAEAFLSKLSKLVETARQRQLDLIFSF